MLPQGKLFHSHCFLIEKSVLSRVVPSSSSYKQTYFLCQRRALCALVETVFLSVFSTQLYPALQLESHIQRTGLARTECLSKKVWNTKHTAQLEDTENTLDLIQARSRSPEHCASTPKGNRGLWRILASTYVPWCRWDNRPAAIIWVGLCLICESQNQEMWHSFSFEILPFVRFESHVSPLCFKLNIKSLRFFSSSWQLFNIPY